MARVAVGQLCATANVAGNLAQCQTLARKAVAAGAKALFLPEASDYIGSSPAETISLAQPVEKSEFVLSLQREARQGNLHINVGIHEPASDGRVKNTLVWIDEKGAIAQRYQKVHLFDVDIKGGPVLNESASVEKGMEIVPPFETPVGRVGLSICFDVCLNSPNAQIKQSLLIYPSRQLRFPEISLSLRRQNAQLLTYPSAFTVPTGIAHWETLLRARAIETQSYVIAAAQAGPHNEKRRSYGHSMIVNPWGEVVAQLGDEYQEPEIAVADLDFGLLEKVRREMPLLRRTDIYPEV